METITIVDTSISTDNIGDEIIMDSVNEIIYELFPDAYIFRVPSHDPLSARTIKFIRESSFCFVGGTNLLSSVVHPWSLWRLDRLAANAFGSTRTVCLGTGWNDYMDMPSPESKMLLSTSLSPNYMHAVRDRYTREHLASIGVQSHFTSCPTTWTLTPSFCENISTAKSKLAIITLSAWRPQIEQDKAWIDVVRKKYDRVVFFAQMQDDFEYLRSLGFDDVLTVAATLQAYNKFLENNEVDFIGTRLHGGIRALQKGRRALILSIDNRASEMGKDTGLPVVPRSNLIAIAKWIDEEPLVSINLPQVAIDAWKKQFVLDARVNAEPVSVLPDTLPPPPLLQRIKPALKTLIGRS